MKDPLGDTKIKRPRRTHAEQEADLKAKLAALDAKKEAAARKRFEEISRMMADANPIPVAFVEQWMALDVKLKNWLAAGKPGAG